MHKHRSPIDITYFSAVCWIWTSLSICGCQLGSHSKHDELPSLAFDPHSSRVAEHATGARPAAADAEKNAASYTLAEYTSMALAAHPRVQAARWAVDAAAWQIPVAASLEDPKLSVTALPAPIETAAGRQNVIVGISQKMPARRKLLQKEQMAAATADQARANLAVAEREVLADVHETFAELLYQQQALEVLQDEQEMLVEVTEIITALYKTDKVSQQDVAQAELAELQVKQQLIAARQLLRSAQAVMARLLSLAPDTQLLARPPLALPRLACGVRTMLDQAIAARPALQALIAQIEQDRLAADLARLDYIPDPTLGAAWVGISKSGLSPVADGGDAVLLNVSVNLPVYGKRTAARIRSAEAKALSSARSYDDVRDETLRVVYDRFTRLESQRELIDLLRNEIVPKASETLDVAVKAYSVAQTDVQQVLDNWRKLIRYELALRQLERDYRKSWALLERAVGTDIVAGESGELTRLPGVDNAFSAPPLSLGKETREMSTEPQFVVPNIDSPWVSTQDTDSS